MQTREERLAARAEARAARLAAKKSDVESGPTAEAREQQRQEYVAELHTEAVPDRDSQEIVVNKFSAAPELFATGDVLSAKQEAKQQQLRSERDDFRRRRQEQAAASDSAQHMKLEPEVIKVPQKKSSSPLLRRESPKALPQQDVLPPRSDSIHKEARAEPLIDPDLKKKQNEYNQALQQQMAECKVKKNIDEPLETGLNIGAASRNDKDQKRQYATLLQQQMQDDVRRRGQRMRGSFEAAGAHQGILANERDDPKKKKAMYAAALRRDQEAQQKVSSRRTPPPPDSEPPVLGTDQTQQSRAEAKKAYAAALRTQMAEKRAAVVEEQLRLPPRQQEVTQVPPRLRQDPNNFATTNDYSRTHRIKDSSPRTEVQADYRPLPQYLDPPREPPLQDFTNTAQYDNRQMPRDTSSAANEYHDQRPARFSAASRGDEYGNGRREVYDSFHNRDIRPQSQYYHSPPPEETYEGRDQSRQAFRDESYYNNMPAAQYYADNNSRNYNPGHAEPMRQQMVAVNHTSYHRDMDMGPPRRHDIYEQQISPRHYQAQELNFVPGQPRSQSTRNILIGADQASRDARHRQEEQQIANELREQISHKGHSRDRPDSGQRQQRTPPPGYKVGPTGQLVRLDPRETATRLATDNVLRQVIDDKNARHKMQSVHHESPGSPMNENAFATKICESDENEEAERKAKLSAYARQLEADLATREAARKKAEVEEKEREMKEEARLERERAELDAAFDRNKRQQDANENRSRMESELNERRRKKQEEDDARKRKEAEDDARVEREQRELAAQFEREKRHDFPVDTNIVPLERASPPLSQSSNTIFDNDVRDLPSSLQPKSQSQPSPPVPAHNSARSRSQPSPPFQVPPSQPESSRRHVEQVDEPPSLPQSSTYIPSLNLNSMVPEVVDSFENNTPPSARKSSRRREVATPRNVSARSTARSQSSEYQYPELNSSVDRRLYPGPVTIDSDDDQLPSPPPPPPTMPTVPKLRLISSETQTSTRSLQSRSKRKSTPRQTPEPAISATDWSLPPFSPYDNSVLDLLPRAAAQLEAAIESARKNEVSPSVFARAGLQTVRSAWGSRPSSSSSAVSAFPVIETFDPPKPIQFKTHQDEDEALLSVRSLMDKNANRLRRLQKMELAADSALTALNDGLGNADDALFELVHASKAPSTPSIFWTSSETRKTSLPSAKNGRPPHSSSPLTERLRPRRMLSPTLEYE